MSMNELIADNLLGRLVANMLANAAQVAPNTKIIVLTFTPNEGGMTINQADNMTRDDGFDDTPAMIAFHLHQTLAYRAPTPDTLAEKGEPIDLTEPTL